MLDNWFCTSASLATLKTRSNFPLAPANLKHLLSLHNQAPLPADDFATNNTPDPSRHKRTIAELALVARHPTQVRSETDGTLGLFAPVLGGADFFSTFSGMPDQFS